MKFDKSFFLDEIRDSFYISGLMKRLWAAQLTVIEDVDRVCQKHGIKWFIEFGSLLGAVRHGGYIPWDDDFDICMLREDYDKFNEIARTELPENYTVLDFRSNKYWTQVLRITNTETIELGEEHLKKYCDFQYPAGIDIFCLDYLSEDKEKEEERCGIAGTIMSLAEAPDIAEPCSKEILEILHSLEDICSVKFKYDDTLKMQLYELGEIYYKTFQANQAKYVALMRYWIEYKNHRYPIEMFKGTLKLPFENVMLPVPAGYCEKLKMDYGEFWNINRKGGIHDYPIYGGNEKLFIQMIDGEYPFLYKFNPAHLENEARKVYAENMKKTMDLLEMLIKICNKIEELSGFIGKADIVATIQKLLVTCQDIAVQIGGIIENEFGEDAIEVRLLEQYCEKVYAYHEVLNKEDVLLNKELSKELLNESFAIVNKFINCINKKISNEKIVIIVARADHWKEISDLYNNLLDAGKDVDVLVVPYYMRDAFGNMTEPVFEADKYPKELEVKNYENYDLSKIRPSMIITQLGHDASNYTWTVNPKYYTSVIKKYTENLIYYSPYTINEYDAGDEKLQKSMEHFVLIPGVSHADYTVVNSEIIREAYIDFLINNTLSSDCKEGASSDIHNSFADIWREKISDVNEFKKVVIGTPVDDKTELDDNIIANEQLATTVKKKLLVHFSASTLMHNKEKIIDKIKNIVKIFSVNNDRVEAVWYISQYDMTYLKENGHELFSDLTDISFVTDEEKAISCDAYYGDVSKFIRLFANDHKPVMIANIDII